MDERPSPRPRSASPFDEPAEGEVTSAAGSAAFDPANPLRFRIVHLLAWTACTAVVMAALKATYQNSDHGTAAGAAYNSSPRVAVFCVVNGLVVGGHMMIVGCLALWRRQGQRWQWQPGHWLAAITPVSWVFYTILSQPFKPFSSLRFYNLDSVVFHVGEAAYFFYLASRLRENRWWRITLIAKGLGSLTALAHYVLPILIDRGGLSGSLGLRIGLDSVGRIYRSVSVCQKSAVVAIRDCKPTVGSIDRCK